ncbi:MAG: hypothetical protein WCK57_07635 [Verrucomicrobiae bacterium]
MKPFNLEEAKAGKPICTRDGRYSVKFIAHVPAGILKQGETLIVAIDGYARHYEGNGSASCKCEGCNDLFMGGMKREGWACVNLSTLNDATTVRDEKSTRITCAANGKIPVRLEWEE